MQCGMYWTNNSKGSGLGGKTTSPRCHANKCAIKFIKIALGSIAQQLGRRSVFYSCKNK